MHPTEIATTCPSCAERIWVSDPSLTGETSLPWWDARVTAETECPVCGWEFAVDEEGRVTDDGGLDADGPFEVAPEGELLNEHLLSATCPACTRRFEVGETGVTQCPGCRHRFLVEDLVPLAASRTPGLEGWDEDDRLDDESPCPACGSDGDLDSAGFLALDHDWVLCQDCGWEFQCAELFRDLVAWQRDELTCREDKSERCLVVAADGSGDCKCLATAVGRIRDGGVILIRPGVYTAQVPLALRRLTLRGDGPTEEIRLAGELETVGSRLRLEGLTLKRAMQAHRSQLQLVDCILHGAKETGLELTGTRTALRLRGCRIEQCEGFGVRAAPGTVVRLSGCTLAGNAAGGVQIEGGAWARLRDCRLTGNGGDGVCAGPHSSVFLHRCLLADNDGTGIALHGGRAVVTRCQLLHQKGTGVLLGPRGRLLLRRCEIRQGQAHGLEFGRRARALITACEVTANALAGLSVGPRARIVLARCSVRGNGAAGIRLSASGRLGVRVCACRDNGGGDWEIEPGGCVCVSREGHQDVRAPRG